MLWLAILILSLLAVVNYRIGKKAAFYPPFVFCCVWAIALIVIWLAGDFYYPLSTEALWIFSFGGFAFSLGSALAMALPPPRPKTQQAFSRSSNRMLNALFFVVVCGSPFVVKWIIREAAQIHSLSFLASARPAVYGQEGFGSIAVQNFLILAAAVAMITFREKASGKKRSFFAIVLAVALTFLTGARTNFIPLILSILCLDWIKNRRIRWKLFFALGLVLVILACTTAIYLGKNGADPKASLAQNAGPVFDGLVFYATGPLVAYDRIVRAPTSTPHFLAVTTFFTHLLHRIDPAFSEPYAGMDWESTFVCTGPGECGMNVFTMYFSYIDFGIPGMIAIVAFIGFVITAFYEQAIRESNIAAGIYSVLFSAIVLSLFQEYFLVYLNYQIKIGLIFWMVYSLPDAWTGFGEFVKRAVTRELGDYQGS